MGKPVVFRAETRIQDALDLGEAVQRAFRELGLKCIDCPAAEVEDLRTAALYHRRPLEGILQALNRLHLTVEEKKK